MKKLISLLLAMVMVFSLATVAFAEEPAQKEIVNTSKAETVELALYKLYIVSGEADAQADTLHPVEKLTFKSTPATTNPDVPDSYESGDLTDEQIAEMANLTIGALYSEGQEGTMTITLPVYTSVGNYNYTITENEGDTQGVTYSKESINLSVLVTYDYGDTEYDDADKNYQLTTEIVVSGSNMSDELDDTHHAAGTGTNAGKYKLDTFTNNYDLGTLTIQKEVSGNLGDKNTPFAIDITFTSAKPVRSDITITGNDLIKASTNNTDLAITGEKGFTATTTGENDEQKTEYTDTVIPGEWNYNETNNNYSVTHTVYLQDTDSLTFTNIPDGVTYVIKEKEEHLLDDTFESNEKTKDYTVTYSADAVNNTAEAMTDRNGSGKIEKESTDATKVMNEKKTDVSTGVALDSAPYFVILAVALFGMVALVSKKRYEV